VLVKRGVTLTAIVTEEFKKELTEEVQGALDQLSMREQQITMQMQRYVTELAKTNLEQAGAVRRQLDAERQKVEQARSEMKARLSEVQGLEMGSEYRQGQIEGMVELKVGDNVADKLTGAEVIVKDRVIVEIKEP
jgi:hypothetical protein